MKSLHLPGTQPQGPLRSSALPLPCERQSRPCAAPGFTELAARLYTVSHAVGETVTTTVVLMFHTS
ncbi:hypothetical protein EMEDMD4_1280075 [Sinorhizobium medicae]|uniref:Uncharacterized protein n=1 Tax=Sinorhizobium medicae TaxID=110321 RepID=A0A508WQU6_9HYPH|nr:hypothetical protein EMEDMD4_1280075 [Sinorhizobium medicae]